MGEADELAHWRSRQAESSLLRKLRAMRESAFADLENLVAVNTLSAVVAAGLMVIPLTIVSLVNLNSHLPLWLMVPVTAWMICAVIYLGWCIADYASNYSWDRINLDYSRAVEALQRSDLPLVIADADLRADAYARMNILLPPKWLRGEQEPLEQHVQRAAQNFAALRCYAEARDMREFVPGQYYYHPTPPRIALIALADFFLGQDARELAGWRGREPAPDPPDNFAELGELRLRVKPGPADIGGHVRVERQRLL